MTRRERVNAVYDRYRGVILLVAPLATIVPAVLALFAVMGFGPLNTPATRMLENEQVTARLSLRADAIADTLRAHIATTAIEHGEMRKLDRAVRIDICDRNRRNPTLTATMGLDCEAILRGAQ